MVVSIHAPTRGATGEQCRLRSGANVSIHAPTRGATTHLRKSGPRRPCFNPRAHAGRDLVRLLRGNTMSMFQSTRPRGARPDRSTKRRAPDSCFNPRAHAGRDRQSPSRCAENSEFQSTRPRGARPTGPDRRTRLKAGFNPRAHAGRDLFVNTQDIPYGCFNPRAHAGRDPCPYNLLLRKKKMWLFGEAAAGGHRWR